MKVEAKTDIGDLRKRLETWSKLVGKDVSTAIRTHARIACSNLSRTTQPFGDGKGDVKKGAQAVEYNINKVFYAPTVDGGFVDAICTMADKSFQYRQKNNKKFDAAAASIKFRERLNKYASGNSISKLKKIAEKFNFQGVVNEVDPKLHKAARTGPRKQVPKRRGEMYLYLGPRGKLKAYIKAQQAKVGMTKAGWAVCASKIPDVKNLNRSFPTWVTRNMKRASDSYIIDRSLDEKNPRITMTNAIPWASQCITKKEVSAALNGARERFAKYLNIQIKYELKKRAGLK